MPCRAGAAGTRVAFHGSGARSSLLRITQTETATERRWTLCGRLAGPSVPLLRACWEHSDHETNGIRRVLDLTDVTVIDESGENLLAELRNSGAEFIAAGIATKHLLENLCARDRH